MANQAEYSIALISGRVEKELVLKSGGTIAASIAYSSIAPKELAQVSSALDNLLGYLLERVERMDF